MIGNSRNCLALECEPPFGGKEICDLYIDGKCTAPESAKVMNCFICMTDADLAVCYDQWYKLKNVTGECAEGLLKEVLDWYKECGTGVSPVTAVDADILQEISRRWRRRHQKDEQVFEWEDSGFANSTGPVYRCGRCHGINNPDSAAVLMDRQKEKPPFCPLCGAPMKTGEEGSA